MKHACVTAPTQKTNRATGVAGRRNTGYPHRRNTLKSSLTPCIIPSLFRTVAWCGVHTPGHTDCKRQNTARRDKNSLVASARGTWGLSLEGLSRSFGASCDVNGRHGDSFHSNGSTALTTLPCWPWCRTFPGPCAAARRRRFPAECSHDRCFRPDSNFRPADYLKQDN